MKWGILFRWQSFWVGAHWSPYNKRLCVNLVPFITVWVTAHDGISPDKGTNVYRSDMDEQIKKAVAAAHERQFCRTQKRVSNTKAAARFLRNLSSDQLQALHHATQRAIREEISFEEYKTIVDHIHAEEPCKQ